MQFLAGPRETRSGILGFLLHAIAVISLVLGAIALLLFFELQFLPYHNEFVTWWHRITVLLDIVLLWLLWPSVARGERTRLTGRDFLRPKVLMLAVGSLVPLLQVAEIATFPGEWLDNKLWVEKKINPGHVAASLRALLIEGDVDGAARKPKSVWSNRLVLPGFDAIDHAKFDSEAKFDAVSKPYRFVPVISKGRC